MGHDEVHYASDGAADQGRGTELGCLHLEKQPWRLLVVKREESARIIPFSLLVMFPV